MSGICVGSCRPDDHGGRRQAMPGAHLCMVCADRLRENIGAIADVWPDLDDRLGHETSSDYHDKVTGSPSRGLVINERVSELEREIGNWAWFVAKMIIEERDLSRAPADQSTPALLRWISDWHGDWLSRHPDEGLVEALSTEAFDFAREARRIAYPSGARRLDLPGLDCVEHSENDLGERVKCEGTMFVVIQPAAATMPDLVCSFDRHHRIEPSVWRRRAWRSRLDPEAVAAFIGHISA